MIGQLVMIDIERAGVVSRRYWRRRSQAGAGRLLVQSLLSEQALGVARFSGKLGESSPFPVGDLAMKPRLLLSVLLFSFLPGLALANEEPLGKLTAYELEGRLQDLQKNLRDREFQVSSIERRLQKVAEIREQLIAADGVLDRNENTFEEMVKGTSTANPDDEGSSEDRLREELFLMLEELADLTYSCAALREVQETYGSSPASGSQEAARLATEARSLFERIGRARYLFDRYDRDDAEEEKLENEIITTIRSLFKDLRSLVAQCKVEIEKISGAEKKQLEELKVEIASTPEKIQNLRRLIGNKREGQTKVDLTLASWSLPTFGLMILFLMLIPKFYPDSAQQVLLSSGLLLEMVTVFLLTGTIVILGVGGKIDSATLGTLLGGISGYVLGRSVAQARAQGRAEGQSREQ